MLFRRAVELRAYLAQSENNVQKGDLSTLFSLKGEKGAYIAKLVKWLVQELAHLVANLLRRERDKKEAERK